MVRVMIFFLGRWEERGDILWNALHTLCDSCSTFAAKYPFFLRVSRMRVCITVAILHMAQGGKPWSNKDSDAAMKFFEATQEWYSTWNKKDSVMQVCYFF